MEGLREQLIYKNVPVHICMKSLKPVEQYEVIRLILATRTENIHICAHDSVNSYILNLLNKLPIQSYRCLNQGGNFLPPTFSLDSSETD
jgi:hypothetical protein